MGKKSLVTSFKLQLVKTVLPSIVSERHYIYLTPSIMYINSVCVWGGGALYLTQPEN